MVRTHDAATASPRWAMLAGATVLLVAVCFVFWPGLRAPFFFDDIGSIAANPHNVRPWSWRAFDAPPQSSAAGRPLVAWSLAWNRALGGLEPIGYHAVNIALHALSALLLWALLTRLLRAGERGPASAAGGFRAAARVRLAPWAGSLAWLVALLWAVHPLQSEAVTYVIQRTELLAGAATLGSVLCALIGNSSHRPGPWHVAAVACCLAGMLSKESAAAIPLLVLVTLRASGARSWCETLARAPRLHAGLAACWLPLAWLVAAGSRSASVGFGHGIGAGQWLMTQAQVLPWYLRLSLWPEPLSLVYHWPIVERLQQALLPGSLMLLLLGATVVGLFRRPWLALPGAWFFLALAPSSSIVPIWTEVAAERRMYLPLAAVLALLLVGAAWLLARMTAGGAARPGERRPAPDGARHAARELGCRGGWPRLAAGACLGLTLCAALAARERVALYADQVALWSDTVEHQPASATARFQLGRALQQAGRLASAVAAYEQALALDPRDSGIEINLGNAWLARGELTAAIDHYRAALRLDPERAPAHHNLGLALARAGHGDAALASLGQAVVLDPDYVDARANLAALLLERGRPAAAIEQIEQTLVRAPDHPLALALLEQLRRRLGEGAAGPP